MPLKQIDFGTDMYEKMLKLRQEILRKPLGLTFTAAELATEKDDILVASVDEDDLLGCCVLTPLSESTLRLRQMAVAHNLQGKGIGVLIMNFAEKLAVDKGYTKMIMHARDTAIGFYQKLGYEVVGEEFMEIGLPHHIMEKMVA